MQMIWEKLRALVFHFSESNLYLQSYKNAKWFSEESRDFFEKK